MRLTDDQWEVLAPLIPAPVMRKDGRGRPWRTNRECLEGILWVLKSGARWRDLPTGEYAPYQTCHRRFQQWAKAGVIKRVLRTIAEEVGLDITETFIDGTFASAKKGAKKSGKPSGARVRS